MGRWDARPGSCPSLWPGLFRYQQGGSADASLVRRLFVDQSGLGRSTAADACPTSCPVYNYKGIFFCPSTPSPTVGWEGGRGTGGDDEWPADAAEARVCLALPSSPPPGHLLPVRTLSPPYFCFRGGHEEIIKGHQGVRDTETNHRAWPDQISSASCPPHSTAQLFTPRAVTHMDAFLWAQP